MQAQTQEKTLVWLRFQQHSSNLAVSRGEPDHIPLLLDGPITSLVPQESLQPLDGFSVATPTDSAQALQ